MTNRNLGRWLLVALAIGLLVLAAPVVSAHGDEPTQGNETAADEAPIHSDAAGWASWMESHMTDFVDPDTRAGPHAMDPGAHSGPHAMDPGAHSGPHAMDPGAHSGPHMDVTGDEMPRDVADDHHTAGETNRHGC